MIKTICQNCGKTFEARNNQIKNGQGKYCSHKCHGEMSHKNHTITKICKFCGKNFKISIGQENSRKPKFCSHDCYSKSKVKQMELICETCGNIFTATPSEIKKGKKFCNKTCYLNRPKKTIIRSCKYCGKKFEVETWKIKRGYGKYCSRKCMGADNVSNVKVRCLNCNNEFEVKKSHFEKGEGKYCSLKCYFEKISTRTNKICEVCGKNFSARASQTGKYCSIQCYGIANSGSNSHLWKGGISFGKYCPKFNEEFKERVRNFWGRKCQICGKSENEQIRRLAVHHVTYDKTACCNDKIAMFISLCTECHSKTNHNREYWENALFTYINLYYDGMSYLNQEEVVYLKEGY